MGCWAERGGAAEGGRQSRAELKRDSLAPTGGAERTGRQQCSQCTEGESVGVRVRRGEGGHLLPARVAQQEGSCMQLPSPPPPLPPHPLSLLCSTIIIIIISRASPREWQLR